MKRGIESEGVALQGVGLDSMAVQHPVSYGIFPKYMLYLNTGLL